MYYQWFSEPFAKELAEGEDERLAKHIEERIYQHLMRQTEIGVASEEALDGVVEESDEGKFIQDFLTYGQSTFRITSKWTVGSQV